MTDRRHRPEASLQTLDDQLIRLLREEPVEDGYHHPAEDMLRETMSTYPGEYCSLIEKVFFAQYQMNPAVCSDFLICLGRLKEPAIHDLLYQFSRKGLEHQSVVLRDTAVRVLELAGGAEAISILSAYSEKEPAAWLKCYMTAVIHDLQEESKKC